jgi:hypothetical protein
MLKVKGSNPLFSTSFIPDGKMMVFVILSEKITYLVEK